ncbi:Uncharacterised protein [Klebsiella pneumoniae]|nr:Uncharacterised protein [Klebsiella pneumoniae]
MDIALLNRGWNRTWSDTMVNLEARGSSKLQIDCQPTIYKMV